jgi:hypothetical protein
MGPRPAAVLRSGGDHDAEGDGKAGRADRAEQVAFAMAVAARMERL